MDSHRCLLFKKVKAKIKEEEYTNENDYLSQPARTNLLDWYFMFIISSKVYCKKCMEKSIILLDNITPFFDFDITFQRILLFALLSISLKLFSQNYEQEIMKLLESLNKLDLIEPKISRSNINYSETYLLNVLEWDINILTISNYIEYFFEKYLYSLFEYIKRECFDLCNEYFLEFCLCVFNSNKIPKHSLAVSIILISYDQLHNTNDNFIITNFLKTLKMKYDLDLIRIENYKKILIQNIVHTLKKDTFIINYPDSNIQYVESKFNCCKFYNNAYDKLQLQIFPKTNLVSNVSGKKHKKMKSNECNFFKKMKDFEEKEEIQYTNCKKKINKSSHSMQVMNKFKDGDLN